MNVTFYGTKDSVDQVNDVEMGEITRVYTGGPEVITRDPGGVSVRKG